MTPQKSDDLMQKRGFTLGGTISSGIRWYYRANAVMTVQVIPEREEFRVLYGNKHSICSIVTPWCGSFMDKEQFKRVLSSAKKWIRAIESLYEEE